LALDELSSASELPPDKPLPDSSEVNNEYRKLGEVIVAGPYCVETAASAANSENDAPVARRGRKDVGVGFTLLTRYESGGAPLPAVGDPPPAANNIGDVCATQIGGLPSVRARDILCRKYLLVSED